jgi:hypothetical protein
MVASLRCPSVLVLVQPVVVVVVVVSFVFVVVVVVLPSPPSSMIAYVTERRAAIDSHTRWRL